MREKKMVSYAQNLEDVLLYRALKHIENGFYVDIGAHDPVIGSVTKAFYERGWRGINVEPGPRFQALCKDRPFDMNINSAVGIAGQSGIFYEISSGLSTQDEQIANKHFERGCEIKELEVPVCSLAEILEKSSARDIHFLKIDTEGSEKSVLLSGDFSKHRPWILVIEATYPMTQIQTHHEWHAILEEKQYRFVWFDGLNRWYVSEERYAELSGGFCCPPNFFDNYITYKEHYLAETLLLINKLSSSESLNAFRRIIPS